MVIFCAVLASGCDTQNENPPEDPNAEYYSAITATSGDALLGQIHDLITTTHTKYTSYDDCRTSSIVILTDKGSAADTIMEFYTQEDIAAPWGSGANGTWNREHVWCQSLSNGLWTNVNNSTRSGGTDLHHIRPSEVQLNATRGNNKYGEVTDGTPAYYKSVIGANLYLGGYFKGKAEFEPLDKVKGDIARIVMYVYTHYNTYANVHGTTNGAGQSSCFGTLKFTDVMAPATESNAIRLLLQWNALDPVDEIEIARNDAVYAIQGNRNPFIDHPEYANAIWA